MRLTATLGFSGKKIINSTPISDIEKFPIGTKNKPWFDVTASAISPDGSEAITGEQDGELHIYCMVGDTLKEVALIEKYRGKAQVAAWLLLDQSIPV
ncbi:putative WD-repeat protein [Corchorus olitorius]|uniref:WD-repeat protein n=1 Tax=Corchorus olitorius TaxID=93759 RepID=A0A1R3IMX8_9ROSI|nr:putative WD-repeat protein [Corchorus olitorius]